MAISKSEIRCNFKLIFSTSRFIAKPVLTVGEGDWLENDSNVCCVYDDEEESLKYLPTFIQKTQICCVLGNNFFVEFLFIEPLSNTRRGIN